MLKGTKEKEKSGKVTFFKMGKTLTWFYMREQISKFW